MIRALKVPTEFGGRERWVQCSKVTEYEQHESSLGDGGTASRLEQGAGGEKNQRTENSHRGVELNEKVTLWPENK